MPARPQRSYSPQEGSRILSPAAGLRLREAKTRTGTQGLARTEGLLLDPVYTGKAIAGLIDDARHGRLVGKD
jgi:hypothetical protein